MKELEFCTVCYDLCFVPILMKLYFNGPYFPYKHTLKTWKLDKLFGVSQIYRIVLEQRVNYV